MQLVLQRLVSLVPLENTAGSVLVAKLSKTIVLLGLNHLLGNLSVPRSPTEVPVLPHNISMSRFPDAHHVRVENIVLTDSHSIVLLELFVMAILVEHVMLDLSVLMARAKHHVLVKHTH